MKLAVPSGTLTTTQFSTKLNEPQYVRVYESKRDTCTRAQPKSAHYCKFSPRKLVAGQIHMVTKKRQQTLAKQR